jgi:hypothetical protein
MHAVLAVLADRGGDRQGHCCIWSKGDVDEQQGGASSHTAGCEDRSKLSIAVGVRCV